MIRVQLLGPVAVRLGAEDIVVKGPQQALLLTLLAVQPGRIFTADELIQRAWAGHPPPTASAALRVHLARVRQLLGDGVTSALPRGRQGYALDPSALSTDLGELAVLRDQLAQNPEPAVGLALAERALALWRGEPFGGGVEDAELRVIAEQLTQARLDLEEIRAECLLQLGRHEEAATALIGLVAAQPLRERRSRLLMLAQYRAGRQAEALATYRALRDRLVEETGVDPSEETRRLELRILRQDPLLEEEPRSRPIPDEGRPAAVAPVQRPSAALSAIVADRLASIGEPAARVVGMVAVLADAAEQSTLRRALGLDAEALEDALTAASQVGLAARPGRPGAPVVLPRPELRDAVLDALGPRSHAELDAAAARALAVQGQAALVRAAWHALAAADLDPGGIPELAVRAIDACLAAGANRAADELSAAALAAVDDAPASLTADLLTRRVRALAALARPADAEEAWRTAIDAARRSGDPERFALAVLAGCWSERGFRQEPEVDALLREALAGIGGQPSALRTRLQTAHLVHGMRRLDRRAETGRLIDEIEAVAAGLDDPDALVAALRARHTFLRGDPDPGPREAVAERFRQAAQRSGDPWWCGLATLGLLYDAFVRGDLRAARSLLATLGEVAELSRSEYLGWYHSLTQATLHRELGDSAGADHWAEQAVIRAAAVGLPDALVAAQLHRLLSQFLHSSTARLADAGVGSLWDGPGTVLAHGTRALALAQAGRPAGARAEIERGLASIVQEWPEVVPVGAGLLTQAAHVVGAREFADPLRRLLLPYQGQFAALGQVSATLGPIDRHLGLLAALDEDLAAAEDLLGTAEERCAAVGSPVWRVVSAADGVGVRLAGGRRREAVRLAAEHADAAARLGLGPSLAVLRAALR